MVHRFLSNFTHCEENILLHADNCVGQNKNITMVEYLAWRIITGLSTTKVDSLSQLADVVNSSTVGSNNSTYQRVGRL